MPGDLVSGNFPLSNSLQSLFGRAGQSAQANLPIRTNIEWPVYSGALVDTASLAGATTGVAIAVPVPVDIGMLVSKVSVVVGAAGASTPTHAFGALYSGTTVASPPLIGQSTDTTTTAIAASTRLDFTLTTPNIITAAQAPWGWVWAVVSVTASTIPSVVTTPCGAAASQFRWFTNSPLYFAQTAGTSLGGTAAATLVNASTVLIAPVTFLS
jgi:hypothetical protein